MGGLEASCLMTIPLARCYRDQRPHTLLEQCSASCTRRCRCCLINNSMITLKDARAHEHRRRPRRPHSAARLPQCASAHTKQVQIQLECCAMCYTAATMAMARAVRSTVRHVRQRRAATSSISMHFLSHLHRLSSICGRYAEVARARAKCTTSVVWQSAMSSVRPSASVRRRFVGIALRASRPFFH